MQTEKPEVIYYKKKKKESPLLETFAFGPFRLRTFHDSMILRHLRTRKVCQGRANLIISQIVFRAGFISVSVVSATGVYLRASEGDARAACLSCPGGGMCDVKNF